jgi:hypothetical protein
MEGYSSFLLSMQCERQENSETSGRRMEQFNSCEQQQAMSLTQGNDFHHDHHPHHGHDDDDSNSDASAADDVDVYIHN